MTSPTIRRARRVYWCERLESMMDYKLSVNGEPEEPFFPNLEERWMFLSDITEDLYEMMTKINRSCAALAHTGDLTGDMVTLRHLMRLCWQYYHALDDKAYDEYYNSPEHENSEPEQIKRIVFKGEDTTPPRP